MGSVTPSIRRPRKRRCSVKVLISGASGFVGKKLGLALTARGDQVIAVVRDAKKAKLPFKAELREWDKLGDFTGVDAIVHLAGETVAQRWEPWTKRLILSSRVDTARQLREALENSPAVRPQAYISASAIGIYGDRGEALLKENELPGSDFLSDVCVDWEKSAQAFRAKVGRVAIFRFGLVIGPGGGAMAKMLPAFKLGLGGRLGSGEQWMSWIHVDDLVNMLLFAMDDSAIKGVYNAVSPVPIKNQEFAATLGQALRKPARLPAPAFVLRLLLGDMSSMLLGSQKVSAEKISAAGFRFRFPGLAEALKNL